MALNDWQVSIGNVLLGPGTDYLVLGVEGLGIPGVRSTDSPRPNRRGDFYGNDQLDSRAVQVKVIVRGDSPEDTLTNFRALTGEWYLHEGEDTRPLDLKLPGFPDVRLIGRPRRVAADPFDRLKSRRIDATLEYYVADPVLYSATINTLETNLQVVPGGRTYPRTYPRAYGSGTSNIISANNSGNHPTPAVFTVYGPCVGPRIEHVTQGRALDFALTLPAGDFLEVDTDARSVLQNGTANRRASMTPDSEWFEMSAGSNDIRFTADGYDALARLTLDWRDGWVG